MANTREFNIPSIWGASSLTTIPLTPVEGASYRDTALTDTMIENGWPFARIVDSSEFNQFMFLAGSLLNEVDTNGVAGWTNLVGYGASRAMVRGSDDNFYVSATASGPGTAGGVRDPIVEANRPTYWRELGDFLGVVIPDPGDPVGETEVQTGMILPFGGSVAPSGYFICDGQEASRTTSADLFNVIGVQYGTGNGTTTFNLPDLRGRTVVGAGEGTGLTNRQLASTAGEEEHTLTLPEMASHGHGVGATRRVVDSQDELGNFGIFPSTDFTQFVTDDQGGDMPHNNMQPFISLNYIIKT